MSRQRPPASLLVVPAHQTAELDRMSEEIGVPAEQLLRAAIDAWLSAQDPGYAHRKAPPTPARIIHFPDNGSLWQPEMS